MYVAFEDEVLAKCISPRVASELIYITRYNLAAKGKYFRYYMHGIEFPV